MTYYIRIVAYPQVEFVAADCYVQVGFRRADENQTLYITPGEAVDIKWGIRETAGVGSSDVPGYTYPGAGIPGSIKIELVNAATNEVIDSTYTDIAANGSKTDRFTKIFTEDIDLKMVLRRVLVDGSEEYQDEIGSEKGLLGIGLFGL